MSDIMDTIIGELIEYACEEVMTRWPLVGALGGTAVIVGGAYLTTPSPYDIWVLGISVAIIAAVMVRSMGWLRRKPRDVTTEG